MHYFKIVLFLFFNSPLGPRVLLLYLYCINSAICRPSPNIKPGKGGLKAGTLTTFETDLTVHSLTNCEAKRCKNQTNDDI